MPQASFKTNDFVLYLGDSLSLITTLEDNSVDIVFADPPYFLSSGRTMDIAGRKVNFEKGAWDRCRSTEDKYTFMDKIRSLSDFIGIK